MCLVGGGGQLGAGAGAGWACLGCWGWPEAGARGAGERLGAFGVGRGGDGRAGGGGLAPLAAPGDRKAHV